MYRIGPGMAWYGCQPCPPAYPPVCPPAYPPAYPVEAIACALQEIEFWSQIEREHTLALRLVIPTLDEATVNELARLEGEYSDIGSRARMLHESLGVFGATDAAVGELGILVNRSISANTRFVELMAAIAQANPESQPAQLFAPHFTSETRYYQRILHQVGRTLHPGIQPWVEPWAGPVPQPAPGQR